MPMIFFGALIVGESDAPSTALRAVPPPPLRGGGCPLRGFPFEIGLPLPERGEAVHSGAVAKGPLGGGDVLRFARPRLCGAACKARP